MARVVGTSPFGLFLIALLLALAGAVAAFLAELELGLALVVTLCLIVSFLALLKSELAILFLIFSMLLSPEFVLSERATAETALQRGLTFRLDDLLLIVVALSWLIKSAIVKELNIFPKTPLNWAILAYIFTCTLATLIGVAADRVHLVTGILFLMKYLQYFMLFFMVVNSIESREVIHRYWGAVVITALIVATVGIAQIPAGERVTAPFEGETGEPNTFGGYLAFISLICLGLAISYEHFKSRVFYLLAAGYLMIPLVFTLSRAAYTAFLPGLAVIILLSRKYLLMAGMILLVLIVFLFPALLPDVISDRVSLTWDEQRASDLVVFGRRVDTSTAARIVSYERAIADFVEHPLLGYGVTGWRFIDAQYFRVLVETGILGLVTLLFLFFRIAEMARQRYLYFLPGTFERGLVLGYIAGFVCLIFHGFGSNTFIIVRIMEPFWLMTAIVFMTSKVAGSQTDQEAESNIVQAA